VARVTLSADLRRSSSHTFSKLSRELIKVRLADAECLQAREADARFIQVASTVSPVHVPASDRSEESLKAATSLVVATFVDDLGQPGSSRMLVGGSVKNRKLACPC